MQDIKEDNNYVDTSSDDDALDDGNDHQHLGAQAAPAGEKAAEDGPP